MPAIHILHNIKNTTMQVYNYLKLFLVIIQTVIAMPKKQDICPGSPAWKHAKCKMLVTFQNNCSAVASEIILRLTSSAWIDPHNQGTYELLSQHENLISGQRITGGGQYTDLFTFSLDPGSDRDSGSCQVTACSESQVFSILDFYK